MTILKTAVTLMSIAMFVAVCYFFVYVATGGR